MSLFCAKASLTGETYTTQVQARHHEWVGDEPIDLGGEDKGMTPSEMLCGALATCTAITLKMYASRKEWPLESVNVEVEHHSSRQRTDTEKAESDLFIRHIELAGDLTEDQKVRLIQIANKCPVHKTLTHASDIDTRLVVCAQR
jgi:putative redox protein